MTTLRLKYRPDCARHVVNTYTILTLLLALAVGSCTGDQTTTTDQSEDNRAGAYKEQHRPQYHFSPEANWMNDPNGMYYYEGTYHLFYQYYPESTVWGPMHWGHAESNDLVTWTHLPIALYPDSLGCIFSGGAVVDNENTSGLGSDSIPPVVATFTHHNFEGEKAKTNAFQYQSIAYSKDGGTSWSKYAKNPVIPNTEKIKDFRDPKVVWHTASNQWILVLAAYDKVKFYGSPNLLEWSHLSDFGIEGDQRLWECPDLFPMKVKDSDEIKWVLIVSIQKEAPNGGTASSYFVGDFDGHAFTANPEDQQWLDYGTDNYAFVTWNNLPNAQEEIRGIGWMSNWQYAQEVPTKSWRSAMTLPRELSLTKVKEGSYQIYSQPVSALKTLKTEACSVIEDLNIVGTKALKDMQFHSQDEVSLSIDLNLTQANVFGIKIANATDEHVTITFDKEKSQMLVDRTSSSHQKFNQKFYERVHTAPVNMEGDKLDVHIYFDVASAEIFINHGETTFTTIYFPTTVYDGITCFASEGNWHINKLEICKLNSIW